MTRMLTRISLILTMTMLVFTAGCLTDGDVGDDGTIVIYEKFCVPFEENRTSGDFESEVVCETFAQEIGQWLEENNVNPKDVMNIFMSGGSINLLEFDGDHPWTIRSRVVIRRRDVGDGPLNLTTNQTVNIPESFDTPYIPRFNNRGIRIVNRALWDFLEGGTPELVVIMAGTDVNPAPSEQDPLVFTWEACINIAIVIQAN